jgi:NADH dehydrogenase
VDADLDVPGQIDIFVIGDSAASAAWNGKPVRGSAPVAKQGGRLLAIEIIRAKCGAVGHHRRSAAAISAALRSTIGRQSGVAEIAPILVTNPYG